MKTPDKIWDKIHATAKEMEKLGLQTEAKIIWSAEDILFNEPDLTPQQVADVLGLIERKHDASLGVCWDTIEYWINQVKEESEENAS